MVIIEQFVIEVEDLNGIYKDIAEHLGIETAKLFYAHYKGLQITFPTRFLSKECIRNKICTEYNGENIRELARKYGYSERWIRKILSNL